ncbi:MAG: tetratricopeptide repeat protein [Verrucomicrobia bacterium]|nr:tetratricopeptide repeat protein [Verrucomicrobiota bacterium]
MQVTKQQIAGILAGSLLILWLLGSSALFLFVKHRKGYEAIQFTDVAFPWNWDDVRPKWGDYFIEKGIGHQEAGEWDKAFYFIRVGISKSPSNLEGRLALADLLFQANDVTQAVKVLEAGLKFASQQEEFWEKMINFLQYYQADQEIIRILKRGLVEDLVPEAQNEGAEAALAKAYFHQAQFEAALEIIKGSSTISNQLLRNQIHWDQGLESLAIQSLETLNSMFPNQREIVPQLTRYYQKSGDTEKAKQLARFTYLNNPYSIGASVNYFRMLEKDAPEEIERFLTRVPEIYENQDALFLLANYLAEAGFHQKLKVVVDQSSPSFAESPMVWFLQVESKVNGRDFKSAEEMLNNPPESINKLIPLHRILFHSLSLATYYALGADDQGKISMQQLFVSGHIRPATLLRLSRKLIEINQPVEAGKVLQFLLKQNPGNHAALLEKIRIELMSGRIELAIAQGKTMVENKTMSFELMKELLATLTADQQLHHLKAAELVEEMLAGLTPSKKQQLLEVL